MKKQKEIKVCSNHQSEEVTPLIWTFAFNGSEYWCPNCGFKGGMFGSGENVESTKELRDLLKKYTKESKPFLRARSILVCSELKYRGKWIKPSELPEKVREKYKKVATSWVYKD